MLCVRAVAVAVTARAARSGDTSPRPTDEAITPPERSWTAGCTRIAGLVRLDQIQLLQDGHSVIQPDLLDDQAVDDLENRRSGEPHRLVGAGR
jgi:hypothetical protein